MISSTRNPCRESERVSDYLMQLLPADEVRTLEAHVQTCASCRDELDALSTLVDAFATWPIDVLKPSRSLQQRLAERIAPEAEAAAVPPPRWKEPEWNEVAPGIFCQLLATDAKRQRVSMMVRLLPGVEYPPHTHAGTEELHLLDGELWIDDRKLYAGDYNRAEASTSDKRVWSETGCTCVLITSTEDVLG